MDDRKVVRLDGRAAVVARPVYENVVATCRELLEMAESGEIVAIGVAKAHADGTLSWEVAGDYCCLAMVGNLERMKRSLLDELEP